MRFGDVEIDQRERRVQVDREAEKIVASDIEIVVVEMPAEVQATERRRGFERQNIGCDERLAEESSV